MFLTICGGEYTINLNQISYIEWNEGNRATINLVGGMEFYIGKEDADNLKRKIAVAQAIAEV
jgi:hypothetical protein